MSDSTGAVRLNRVVIRGETWRTVAAVLFLLVALAGSQLVVTTKKMARLQREVSGSADSLQLARGYGPLVNEAFDLQQELDARNTGIVSRLSLPMAPPPGAPPGIRPVPVFNTRVSASERERIRALLAGVPPSPQRRRVRVSIAQAGTAASRPAGTLRQLGFTVLPAGEEGGHPVNAITFGDSVPLADVRLAAYALIDAGLSVMRIRRSVESNADPRMLTISNVRWAMHWPPLTTQQIEELRVPPEPATSP
jgi:hypothetical protein